MTDQLTARSLATASALLDAASKGDRFAMRRILRTVSEPSTDDTIGSIVAECASHYRVQVGHILGQSRLSEVCRARMAACYIAHLHGYSYSHIGRQLERDHSTVMHAVARVSASPTWRADVEALAMRTGWAGAA
jgi:chromosomal replication initiation ATPase DnaA